MNKGDSSTNIVRGDGYDADFGLSARAPYANLDVNPKNPSPPVTPSPGSRKVVETKEGSDTIITSLGE
jgi:hypothetical protein